MYDWIYKHFINTNWFLIFGLSLPSLLGLYLIYRAWKDSKQENDVNQQGEQNQGNQGNQDDLVTSKGQSGA